MRFLACTTACVAAFLSGVLAAQQPQATPPAKPAAAQEIPVFRTGVELVSVAVTVTDPRGRFVTDLTQQDFAVFEDARPQEIVSFTGVRDEAPVGIGLGLVLDASLSMTPNRRDSMRLGADLLLRKLRQQDEAYVLSFAAASTLAQPWTSNRSDILRAIRRMQPRPGTSLLDATLEAMKISATGTAKKQAVLLITDGMDTHSKATRTQLAEAARASEIVLYVFVVDDEEDIKRGRADEFARQGAVRARQAALELNQIAGATGGHTTYLRGFQELEDAIDELGKEVTQQYFIQYERPARSDRQYREIHVTVKRENVTVRHRHGYLAN